MRYLFFFSLSFLFCFAEIVEEIYYIVNDELITKMDFEEQKKILASSFQLQEGSIPQNLEEIVISNMIVNKLIEYEAHKQGIDVSGLDVSNQIRAIAHRNKLGTIENLKEILPQQGMSWEYFYNLQRLQIFRDSLERKMINIDEPSREEIRRYYEEHRDEEFKIKDKALRLRLIYLKKEPGMTFSEVGNLHQKAAELRKKIVSGEMTFEEAAKAHSDDVGTKPLGGDAGWKIPGDFLDEPNVEKAVFSLPAGQVSTVVSSDKGLYLLKVEEILREGAMPFEKAYPYVKQILVTQQRDAKFLEIIEKLKTSAIIEKNTDFFKDYDLK